MEFVRTGLICWYQGRTDLPDGDAETSCAALAGCDIGQDLPDQSDYFKIPKGQWFRIHGQIRRMSYDTSQSILRPDDLQRQGNCYFQADSGIEAEYIQNIPFPRTSASSVPYNYYFSALMADFDGGIQIQLELYNDKNELMNSTSIRSVPISQADTLADSSQFNLDYTDGINEVNSKDVYRHTCLYSAASSSDFINVSQWIISYCLSEWQSEWNMKTNNRDRRFTFTELREQAITSQQLYRWSAPMDLVERYRFFLQDPTIVNEMDKAVYYNCSFPWFGPMCEYTFDQYESDNLSFSDIVHNFYTSRDTSAMFTCYEHLQCDRGGPVSCLDWSEICDKTVDCLNGGIDEEHCWQLEINECQNNEFRCLNGQCIDDTLYHDDRDNPDCSDGSDEVFEPFKDVFCMSREPIPSCEDITCAIHQDLDGMTYRTPCSRKRKDFFINQALFVKEGSTLDMCWLAFSCLAKPRSSLRNISCAQLCLNNKCTQLVEDNCPPLIYLPSIPVLFNHVYFVYTKKEVLYHPSVYATPPDYVCYTQQLCPELLTTVILPTLNNATCRRHSEIPSFHGSFSAPRQFSGIIERLSKVFWACRSIINAHNSSVLCNMSSMYRCLNTSKCISIYGINNGIRDCFYGDDEQQIMTSEQIMSLKPPKNWYKCEKINMSIASYLIDNGACYCGEDCDDQIDDDTRYSQTHVSFQTICDGFTELRPLMIDSKEKTDETDCEQWPCNNIYTHCNGIWNCENGADELGCNPSPSLNCKSDEHVCVSPSTYKFMCLPIRKAHDGIADCLGGTDEPQLCQRNKYENVQEQSMFFCLEELRNCTRLAYLCQGYDACDNGDDVNFCTLNQTTMGYGQLCEEGNALVRSDIDNYFCQNLSFAKKKTEYFTLGKPVKPIKQFNTIQTKASLRRSRSTFSEEISLQQNHCYRGLNMRVLVDSNKNITTTTCLCPPNYYGGRCQYQNQRVSLTLRLTTWSDSWNISFAVVVSLIDDDHLINLSEQVKQFTYLFARDCQNKVHLSLLYSTRPKNITKNYFIHIDVYEKQSLTYRASWSIPILFSFLPVHRITTRLTIPSLDKGSQTCNISQCINGQCTHYVENSMNKTFCRCNQGWFGRYCTIPRQCACSDNSVCIGITANNRSLCVCRLENFGPRCLLNQTACQNAPCQNGGYCVPIDENMPSENKYKCICPDGFRGEKCELTNTEIVVTFQKDISLPQSILVHLIQAFGNYVPNGTTKYKKIPLSNDSITMHSSHPFHILIVEFLKPKNYYLGGIQTTFSGSTTIRRTINASHRCQNISELFNETFLSRPLRDQIKYYHLPCQKNSSYLFCFFDKIHMCFCTDHDHQRLSNCMEFDQNTTQDCLGQSICENGGACYYDNPTCPRASVCRCSDCFYGTRCEFSTEGLGLSLDAIIGYYIQPYTSLLHQPSVIQVSATLTMIMFVLGIINGVLCIITFKVKKLHEIGCGRYLTCLAILSPVTMTMFTLKFWLLVLSQMALITNRPFLHVQCFSLDFLLRVCLSMDQWLSVCVAIERVTTIVQGTNFNKKKSKQIAKWLIFVVVICTTSSVIQEIIHRRLIEDNDGDEKRTWCIISYSQTLAIFNSIVHIFHVAVPCLINLISAVIIITAAARQRAIVHTHQTYRKHLREQFQQHRHLLTAPCVLVILAVPRLVLAFSLGCMKSARSPWLFLAGYFISFIPPLVTFIIFVLPSETYKKEFSKSFQQYWKTVQRCMRSNS